MNITETSLHPDLLQLQMLITNSICLCNWSVDVSGHKQGLRMVTGGRMMLTKMTFLAHRAMKAA